MAKKYLERLSEFVSKAAPDIPGDISLERKHFFSGAALYAEGSICISLTPSGLAMKLPEPTKHDLFQNGKAVPLRYFSQGPIKKGYALFLGDVAESGGQLYGYVEESIEYVPTLSKPERKREK